jgi:hypothetical protein
MSARGGGSPEARGGGVSARGGGSAEARGWAGGDVSARWHVGKGRWCVAKGGGPDANWSGVAGQKAFAVSCSAFIVVDAVGGRAAVVGSIKSVR